MGIWVRAMALLAAAGGFAVVPAVQAAGTPPNIVVIVADDLGFSDLGCYGGEIETPALDGLAARGLRFTQFYNTGRCWPTRAALLTGYYPHQVRRDALEGVPDSGARGARPAWAPLLPERLRPLGYRSYHSGKWHLDGMPLGGGFDRSYYLRDQGRFFSPKVHYLDDEKLPPVGRGSGFYGTAEVAGRAIGFLQDHGRDHPGSPFFLYVAFAAPHFPLHALPDDIDRYRGRYGSGWETVRRERWERQRAMALFAEGTAALSAPEPEVGPPYHFPKALEALGSGEVDRPLAWDALTEIQKGFQSAKMELHAAMVHRMDLEVGRVLDQLRAMGTFENTLVVFLSDNGASAEIMVRDDGHDPGASPGSAGTYLCLGPGWSTVANTPFRRHKTWNHEGGIATPLIAHWPAGIADAGAGRAAPGHVIDFVPTLLALAGAAPVAMPGAPPLPGVDLGAYLTAGERAHGREFLWWAHEGNRALRAGDWKVVAAGDDAPWELYNLAADRAETRDLAAAEAGRAAALAERWARARDQFAHDANRGGVEGRP